MALCNTRGYNEAALLEYNKNAMFLIEKKKEKKADLIVSHR